jgi:DNA-binding CsgD family transcriptional regulator
MAGWPLVGRQRELEQILDAVSRGRGAVVLGPDGAGRSRLAGEVGEWLAQQTSRVVLTLAGSHTAQQIPLGAVAPALSTLVPQDTGSRPDVWNVLQHAHAAVRALADDGEVSAVVDDAHLLDPISATLLEQIATTGAATVVATCPVDDETAFVRALWKDHGCERIELRPLGDDDVRALSAAIIGGTLDDNASDRLCSVADGSPLQLREAIHELTESGVLRQQRDVWVWDGDVVVGPRLHDLVGRRLGGLGAGERRVMEALAVGGPLPVDVLTSICEPKWCDALERRGLIAVDTSADRMARLAHPLDGEVLRAELPRSIAARLRCDIADALGRCHGAADRSLQIALLRLDAGVPADHSAFVRAADDALARGSPKLAERLAATVVAAGCSAPAAVTLGEALVLQGRPTDAEVHLAGLALEELDDDLLERAVMARIDTLAHGLGRLDDAAAVVERASRLFSTDAARDLMLAAWASALGVHGRHEESLTIASRLSHSADLRVRLTVWPAVNLSLIQRGQIESAVKGLEQLIGAHSVERASTIGDIDQSAVSSLLLSYLLAGCLDEADELAARVAADPQPGRRGGSRVFLEILRGKSALLRGRVLTAQDHLRAAVAGHDRIEGVAWRAWALALLAESCALAGDVDEATALEREVVAALPTALAVFVPDVRRACSWVRAAKGDPAAAVRELVQIAKDAAASSLPASELAILHDALRLGAVSDIAQRIVELGPRVESRWVAPYVSHATGLLTGDVDALADAADGFAAIGAYLCAADAATHAALVAAGHSKTRSARETARAARWAADCEGASTPLLGAAPSSSVLTPREREVAGLAVKGMTSKEISSRLGVSARTVDNLLGRVYGKLGVSGREQLPDVLPPRL